uniref:Transmembrane protein 161B n=1 Tax=Clytia hemisphaerica TaxID=252671 RepID=A0A069DMN5_9CNID
MALLGIQFVITLVVALFLQKLSPYYSFARWIMCSRLYRYLHPSNELLRATAGKPINQGGKGKRKKADKINGTQSQEEIFTVPCNMDIVLGKVEVNEMALVSQYKYTDYKWLVDFSVCAVIVYLLIEMAASLRPQIFVDEFNVGIVWCMLVVYFALRELFSLTAAYWRSEDGGERAMAISFGFFFLVVALGVLVVDEEILDFGLNDGYKHFAQNLETFYKAMDFSIDRAPSVWAFKIFLAIFSALVGAVLGFPGIRYANMHLDSVYYYERGNFGRLGLVFLNVVFFSPLLMSLLWVLPLSRELMYFRKGNTVEKLLSNENFLFLRVHLMIFIILARLLVTRQLLQSHLDSARQKVDKFKMETGRVSNRDLQRTVARVFYYLSAAALQYLAPLLLMLFLGFMLRSLTYNLEDLKDIPSILNGKKPSDDKQLYAKLIRSLMSVKLAKGVTSFLCWWTNVTFFMTSCFGVVYFKYLS